MIPGAIRGLWREDAAVAAVTEFDLESFLPYQLAVLASRVSRGFAENYRDRFGISVAEWRVVAHLSTCDRVSIREITERVDMEKSKVSRAASRLQAAGYVAKRTDSRDRRLVELTLTAKGRAMIAAIAPLARQYEADLLEPLGNDAPRFRKALRRLVDTTSDGANA